MSNKILLQLIIALGVFCTIVNGALVYSVYHAPTTISECEEELNEVKFKVSTIESDIVFYELKQTHKKLDIMISRMDSVIAEEVE
jgi:hypothetical protein